MVKNRHLMALLFLSLALPGRVEAADDVFDSNGIKIRYLTEGKGEPIVLLHGWMGDSSMWGRLDTNPATKEYQLIAVDLRGHLAEWSTGDIVFAFGWAYGLDSVRQADKCIRYFYGRH